MDSNPDGQRQVVFFANFPRQLDHPYGKQDHRQRPPDFVSGHTCCHLPVANRLDPIDIQFLRRDIESAKEIV